MLFFSEQIIKWYHKNKRDLPWRNTKDPYKIWLSEIILQQTRVEQGMNYYLAFVEQYPTVKDLAKASEQEVLRLWQGLGYYSRARNLHFSARYIATDLGGKFPQKYKDLLKLKGVGSYTASAIASFAYGEKVPAIDGNVYRVLSRLFGVYEPLHTSKATKMFWELGEQLISEENPADFNQAMMELGALVCKPQNLNCNECPVVASCYAFEYKKWQELPVKKSATAVRNRYFNYFVIECENKILLKKREGRDVWKHLYEFPLLEKENATLEDFSEFLEENLSMKKPTFQPLRKKPILHKLSHQHLHITFWSVVGKPRSIEKYILVDKKRLSEYPMPIVLVDFLSDYIS